MESESENLCADAGYAGEAPRKVILAAGYEPHVRSRSEERREKVENTSYKPRRWVVEACHSWFNRFRKLTIRYEKLGATHLALIHLAAAIIALRKIKTKVSYPRQSRGHARQLTAQSGENWSRLKAATAKSI